MKKNRMMRIASCLLVLVLLTTCVISGTFAKYVTSKSSSDTARVAKWGVTIIANGDTFADDYETDDVDAKSVIAKSVISVGSNDNIVAPGTKGDMVAMQLTGTPEVAVKVTYTANLVLEGWTVKDSLNEDTFYLPIIIIINGVEYSAEGTGCATMAAFETYIENKIAEYSCQYAAKTDLADSSVRADSLSVSWKWAFEGNDNYDTQLGNLADAPTISLTVNTTVTQID